MGFLDVIKQTATNVGTEEFFRGTVQQLWKKSTFQEIYKIASEGKGLADMAPEEMRKMREALSKPELVRAAQRITYPMLMNWLKESNGPLLAACLANQATSQWLWKIWTELLATIQQANAKLPVRKA